MNVLWRDLKDTLDVAIAAAVVAAPVVASVENVGVAVETGGSLRKF